MASVLLGLEKAFSPFSLSFRSSIRSRVQTDRIFGAQSRDNERHGITPPCSPVRVLGSGVYRGTVPGPRGRPTRLQVASGAVQHQSGAGGSPEPRAPSPRTLSNRAFAQQMLSSFAASRPWAPFEPTRPRPRRTLSPTSGSSRMGANTSPLPFPCKRFLWNGQAGSTGLSPSPQNLNKLGGRQGKVSNGP